VRAVLVAEGQTVKRGQLLLEMDGSELQANLAQAAAAEQLAASNLRLLSELKKPLADQAVAQAQLYLRGAQRTAARAQELYAQGFYGAAATEEAQRALDLAQTQVTIAAQQWSSLQSLGAETASAKAALRQAQAASQTAQARLRYSRISAPVDGIVIARNVEVGDGVQPGKVLMVLSPQGAMQLVLQIDEKNLKWLHAGQNALASADAFAEQKFAAQVAFINPAVDPQRGAIEVRLDVTDAVPQLRQDMTVSVAIEVARKPQALHIPLTAVHDANQAAPWVLVWRDGRAQRQPVVLGLQSQGRAQVLNSLQAGALLVPVAQSTVHEGDRVRQALP
jgi:HlyD family secretion protein